MNIIIIIDRCLTIFITMKIIHQQLTIVKTLPGKPQLIQPGGSFQNSRLSRPPIIFPKFENFKIYE